MRKTSTRFRGLGWALCVLLGFSAFDVAAQSGGGQLEISNRVYQEVEVKAADGKVTKKMVPAIKVVPGGEVIYEIEYANLGTQAATEVAINNPLPRELVLEDDSRTPATEMSVDHGAKYGKLTALTVTGEDGKPRPAQMSDVTDLRWIIPSIKAGAKGKVSFRARVR